MGNKNTRYSIVTAAATLAGGMLLMSSANAMMEEELSVFGDAVELSDNEMGDMRGRFLNGNQLSYFGVEMYTRWTNSSGETLNTGLVLGTEVSSSAQLRPTVTVFQASEHTAQGSANTQSSAGTSSITSSGLDNGIGITQAIQVAGDLNQVSNELSIDVGPEGSVNHLDIAGTPIAVNGPGTTTLDDGAGNMTTFSLNRDGFGYTVINQSQDQITQMVSNATADSARGIAQSVQITTNLNQVVNVTNIVVEHRQLGASIRRPVLNAAFLSLRGL